VKSGEVEAFDIKLDLTKRSVGYVTEFDSGFGWIKDFNLKDKYFVHYSKIKGVDSKYISIEAGDPVIFTKGSSEKGKEALDVVKVDTRCSLETFADFDDFNQSLLDLKALSEGEH